MDYLQTGESHILTCSWLHKKKCSLTKNVAESDNFWMEKLKTAMKWWSMGILLQNSLWGGWSDTRLDCLVFTKTSAKPEANWSGSLGSVFASFVFCATEWFVFVARGGLLDSGFLYCLGCGPVCWWWILWLGAVTPVVEPEPCSCSLLCSGSAGIASWALGKSGILCPLQATQSRYVDGGPGDTRLAPANPNIQFTKCWKIITRCRWLGCLSSGLQSVGGYGGH